MSGPRRNKKPSQALKSAPRPAKPWFLTEPNLVCIALLVAATWICRYWYFRDFGLYEDDHWRITVSLAWSWERLLDRLASIVTSGFGRTGHEVLIYLLSRIGWDVGGVPGMHLIGFCVLAVNNVLLYFLLRRMEVPRAAALFGSFLYALFPPDRTQMFLTHTFGIHPALTCFLAGAHLFLAGRRVIALLAVLPCLFIYESVYLVFLAVPLLALAGNRIGPVRAGLHITALAGVFYFIGKLRIYTGDTRSIRAADNIDRIIPAVWRNFSTGPAYCFKWTFVLPGEALQDLGSRTPVFLAAALLSGFALWWLWRQDAGTVSVPDGPPAARNLALRYLGVGILMLFLAYPLVFELNPVMNLARNSRVHLAAAVGAAIVFSSLVWFAQQKLRHRSTQLLAVGVLALFCGSLTLSAFRSQDDLRHSWSYQQALWTDVIQESPDIAPGTLILVQLDDLVSHHGFWPWPWEHTRLAEHFYRFPRKTKPPRLFFMQRGWESKVAESGDLFDGVNLHAVKPEVLEQHRGEPVHFYKAGDGRLRRAAGTLRVGPHEFELAPLPPQGAKPAYEIGAVWRAFVRTADAPPVDYLARRGP